MVNNLLLKYGGDTAVGAIGIFATYTGLLCMTVVGVCQGVQPILGYNYGALQFDRLRKAFWMSVGVGLGITTFGAAVAEIFPGWIAMAFTNERITYRNDTPRTTAVVHGVLVYRVSNHINHVVPIARHGW